jgi:lipoprotein-releasing system permease protein
MKTLRNWKGVVKLLPVKIALRFLKSSKMQTILIVLGLGIGIAVQIFVGLLLQNLQASFIDSIAGNSSHITVLPGEDEVVITEWESIVLEIEEVNGIKTVSVTADSPALLTSGPKSNSIFVRGVIFDDADRIYGIEEALYEGNLPANASQIIVGKELTEDMGLFIDNQVTLINPDQEAHTFWISGFYDLGLASLNERWVFMGLSSSQDMFGLNNSVTSIETQITDIFSANEIAEDVVVALDGEDVVVENWEDNNQELFSAIAAQSASSYMIQTFVLMSVVIGIASVLSISVVQKSRQIGILKAMGTKDRQSSLIFMFQGLFLGIGGAVAGMCLGVILYTGFISAISTSSASFLGSRYNVPFIIASGLVAVISSVVASLLPALKSRKLDPIEVIRNG